MYHTNEQETKGKKGVSVHMISDISGVPPKSAEKKKKKKANEVGKKRKIKEDRKVNESALRSLMLVILSRKEKY